MKMKSTGDLQLELMKQPNLDAYLKDNQALLYDGNIAALLSELYDKKQVNKAVLARRAGMSTIYLHQVFAGKRRPSRDRLLCICIGLGASLEEIQLLLKKAVYAPLYVKNRRDSIIYYGILSGKELASINDLLFSRNEKTLC